MLNNYIFKIGLFIYLFFILFTTSSQISLKADSVISRLDSISDNNERVIAICKIAQRTIGTNMELSILLTPWQPGQ
jgi:hypothetical protein